MNPKVSVIVVCFNNLEYTRRCVGALYADSDPGDFELILVDNASSDGTAEYFHELVRARDNIKIQTNTDNLGFVGGNNSALGLVRGELVFFLNNDTEVQPGWLPPLIETMRDPRIGAAGCKLIYPDGTLQEAGGIVFSDASGANFGRGDNPFHPEYNTFREVDYCSAAALMVRASAWRESGGFDALYQPAYYEDTDLCFSLREMGLKVVYEPESVVVHHEGKTAGTDISSGYKKFQEINRAKFARKWTGKLREQPLPGSGGPYLRKVCDRRFRQKAQVFMGADEPPQYDRQGGALRFFHFIEYLLEAGHHVTFAARNITWRPPDVSLAPYVRRLNRMGVVVHGLKDFQTSILDSRPEFCGIYNIIMGRDFEAALLFSYSEGSYFLDYINACRPKVRVFVDSVDVQFLRKGRECALHNSAVAWMDYLKEKDKELTIYRKAFGVFTATEAEMEFLRRDFDLNQAHFVPDTFPSADDVPDFDEREGLVFLAGFRHPPNLDAAKFLLRDILPHIRSELADVPLYLVGDSPPDSLRQLADEHTIITGWVPSLKPYLSRVRVGLGPITYGAGIKGKICRAMGYGTPNVSTTLGIEGIGLTHGEEVLIADDPASFAREVARLYRDPELWRKLSRAGLKLIRERHSRAVVKEKLLTAMFPVKRESQSKQSRDMAYFDLICSGYSALFSGELEQARDLFKQVLRSYPRRADGYLGLARVSLELGQAQQAEGLVDKASALSSDQSEPLLIKAKCLLFRGRRAAALTTLDKLNAAKTKSASTLSELGDLYFRAGAPDKAEENFTKAIDMEPEKRRIRRLRAELYAALGRVDEALLDLSRISQISLDRNESDEAYRLDARMNRLVCESAPWAGETPELDATSFKLGVPVLQRLGHLIGRTGPISSREYMLYKSFISGTDARPNLEAVPDWLARTFEALADLELEQAAGDPDAYPIGPLPQAPARAGTVPARCARA